jgi:hypothetical protein
MSITKEKTEVFLSLTVANIEVPVIQSTSGSVPARNISTTAHAVLTCSCTIHFNNIPHIEVSHVYKSMESICGGKKKVSNVPIFMKLRITVYILNHCHAQQNLQNVCRLLVSAYQLMHHQTY